MNRSSSAPPALNYLLFLVVLLLIGFLLLSVPMDALSQETGAVANGLGVAYNTPCILFSVANVNPMDQVEE